MDWVTNAPLASLVTDMLSLRLRAERLSLVKKIRLAEEQARALGVTTEGLVRIRQALVTHPLVPVQEPFLRLPASVKTAKAGELRHIQVVSRRGSIF